MKENQKSQKILRKETWSVITLFTYIRIFKALVYKAMYIQKY